MKAAFRIGLLAGVVAVLCLLLLVGDWALAARQAPADAEQVAALVEAVKLDSEVAPRLHDERERQTAASLGRKARARVFAWLLLVSGAGFVFAGKAYMARRAQPLPTLDALIEERFPPAAPTKKNRKTAQRIDRPADASQIDLAIVDGLVERFGGDRQAAIPILQAIQNHWRYLPDEALQRVCDLTEITPAQLAGTSSFYAQFRRSPVGRHVVRICHGTACHVAGAEQINKELRRHLQIADDEDTDPLRMFTLDNVACLGCCSLAPVMMVEDDTAGRLTPAGARRKLDELGSPA
jgi:NADH:ubiquinone oxidoreductase subunit E